MSFGGTLYRARTPETSQVGDNVEFIQTPIAVGREEFSAVHHIFRYAGTQHPFLLGQRGCGECIQVSFEDPLKFRIGHWTVLYSALSVIQRATSVPGATSPSGQPVANPSRSKPVFPAFFCTGDVRHGSIERVASGVGERSMSMGFIHEYLALKWEPSLAQ